MCLGVCTNPEVFDVDIARFFRLIERGVPIEEPDWADYVSVSDPFNRYLADLAAHNELSETDDEPDEPG